MRGAFFCRFPAEIRAASLDPPDVNGQRRSSSVQANAIRAHIALLSHQDPDAVGGWLGSAGSMVGPRSDRALAVIRHDRSSARLSVVPLPEAATGHPSPEQASNDRSDPGQHLAEHRRAMRLRSISWGLGAALVALLISLALALAGGVAPITGLEAALRSAGCGFFYGLLAFHLQRVDPDDSHLQAGLVGAICGLRSLGAPLAMAELATSLSQAPLADNLLSAMMWAIKGWLPLWLPLIGSALVLHGAQRLVPVLRP